DGRGHSVFCETSGNYRPHDHGLQHENLHQDHHKQLLPTKSNQRWMKLRTTVQLSGAITTIQKKPPLKREDSFLKRFSTRQIPETQ
ncbi:hypothetical protein L9F63_028271, partial [Diploptera punctata]